MKIKYYILACALFTTGLVSCIDDESDTGSLAIPELTIAGDLDEMTVLNFNLGNDCVITPDITYTGSSEENLSYTWSVGTYTGGARGALEEVSHEKTLNYFFTEGGSYYAHLVVTDGVVGSVMEYQVNINRTFEEGYVLISSDESGNGNLTFVKILTPEEEAEGVTEVVLEHSLELMNEGYSEKGLLDVAIGSMRISYYDVLQRLLLSMEDKLYVMDPNTFTVLSEYSYTGVFSGYKGTHFLFADDVYYPCAYDNVMNKFVFFDMQYMYTYENSTFNNLTCDDCIVCTYSRWGSPSTKALFVRHNPTEVAEYFAYGPYYGSSYFPSTGDLFASHELLSAFLGAATSETTYQTPLYAMTQNPEVSDSVYLYTTNSGQIYRNSFTERRIAVTANTAIPEPDTHMVASPSYNRYFYAIDNNIYVLLIDDATFTLADKSRPSISFPSNEVVTYTYVNMETEELYVATYDTTTKRGNFYIYNTSDVRADNLSSPTPKESHLSCADRITSIMYKPSMD